MKWHYFQQEDETESLASQSLPDLVPDRRRNTMSWIEHAEEAFDYGRSSNAGSITPDAGCNKRHRISKSWIEDDDVYNYGKFCF